MKPARLEVDPNSFTAAKEWKHWRRTFENYVEEYASQQATMSEERRGPALNKLRALVNCISFAVFDYIENCETYDEAINLLQTIYVKKPNTVFARHRLATAKQQSGQSLNDFFQTLKSLSKDCNFQNVTAAQYCNEMIRDAFINGICSNTIWQCLLENDELTLDMAIERARTLDLACTNSQAYETFNTFSAAVSVNSKDEDAHYEL